MISISVSVDAASLEKARRFYGEAFGFAKVAEPFPGVGVLRADGAELLLLAKQPGSVRCPHADARRHYDRHWTRSRSSCSSARVALPWRSAAIHSVTGSASSREGGAGTDAVACPVIAEWRFSVA